MAPSLQAVNVSSTFVLEELLLTLPSLSALHAPGSSLYSFFKKIARREIENLFLNNDGVPVDFKPFGSLTFPYHNMGAVDSLNLFDLDELIIFSFYWMHRRSYRRVLDIGANIGLHSIILSKCGFEVHAYEPDPKHFEIFKRNLDFNHCSNIHAFNTAVSTQAGEMEFVRVLGNTTGSHLAGAKAHPYGELERFPVKVEAMNALLSWADLVKLDIEGHEKEVLLGTHRDHWANTDGLIEVGNPNNATAIYEHFQKTGVRLFSQKTGWKRVSHVDDMPTSYREGTLFITSKLEMPWHEAL
ncbi:MAG: FkbM family methyltransferase [Chlamydiae bacterium]|nr:FkbM family methyltransferase [Chlamydiota bacterium]MBI3276249.1 FkbM family methyltransferase [Chlamydiota bacterium]